MKFLTYLTLLILATGVAAAGAPLRLSLQEASRRALVRNTGLLVERLSAEQAAAAVDGARGAYDLVWTSGVGYDRATEPVGSAFSGAPDGGLSPRRESVAAETGVSRLLPTGGTLTLRTSWGRATTDGVFTILSPEFTTAIGITARQPLLRNRQFDPTREAIRVAAVDRRASDARLEQVVSDTLARVEASYWNLVAAGRNVASVANVVDLAEHQLEETGFKVEAGVLPKTGIAEPIAALERRRGDLALARRQVEEAENTLKLLMLGDPRDPDWSATLVPTDAAEVVVREPNLAQALAVGLERRSEIAVARAAAERAQIRLSGRQNDLKPSLDVVASYRLSGLAGETNPTATGFGSDPVVVPDPISGGIGRSYGTLFEGRFPATSIGLELTIPVGNTTAKANVAIARSRLDQAALGVVDAEQVVGAEIRNAVFAVDTARLRIEAARASRVAAETQLDAEGHRFDAGLSTNFLVLTRQNDLLEAQVTETAALTDYRKAEAELARATGVLLAERQVVADGKALATTDAGAMQ